MELCEHYRRLCAARQALQALNGQLPVELASALAEGLASGEALFEDFSDVHAALHREAVRRREAVYRR